MSTLNQSPLAPLLDTLFAEAEAATSPALAQLPRSERERLMQSKTEYRDFYGLLKDLWLPVSRQTGDLLYILTRGTAARHIVEFGTSFGISTLYLAAGLRDNGGGRVISSEFEPQKVARARRNMADGGVADLVEIREGDALETLKDNLPDSIDLLVLDGAKSLYTDILALVEPRLRPGALILADDADFCPEYLARVRAPKGGYMSVSLSQDIELSMRVA